MKQNLAFILSLLILLPSAAGLLKIRNAPSSFYPMILLALTGLLVEIISFFSAINAVITNVYFLLEMLLWYWQFYNWRFRLYPKKRFYLLITAMSVFWIVENIVLKKITTFETYFVIVHASILVLLAVNQLSFVIVNEKKAITRNPVFVMCCAMIILYSFTAMMEIFYHFAQEATLRDVIFNIQIYVNVIFNLLFFIAVLLIPKRKYFAQKQL